MSPQAGRSVVDPVDPLEDSSPTRTTTSRSQWFDDSYWMQLLRRRERRQRQGDRTPRRPATRRTAASASTPISPVSPSTATPPSRSLRSLTAGTTVFDYSETSGNEIPSSGIGNYWTILGRGMFMPATHRDYLEDGQPGQGTNSTTISADIVRPLLYQQLCDPPLHGQLQPQVGHCRRPVGFRPDRQPQLLQEQLPVSGRQRHQPDPARPTKGGRQTNRLSLQAHVDYNKSFGDHNLSAMAGYDFLKRKINGMSMTVQGAESDKTPTLGAGTTPTAWTDTQTPWCQYLLFRTSELQLQGEIHAGLHHARRRFVALRQG